MEKEFWLNKWESGSIRFHRHEVNSFLLRHWPVLAGDLSEVLVPLCGKSRDLLWLNERGHRVTGAEFSEKAVTDFFTENSLEHDRKKEGEFIVYSSGTLSIYCGDFFRLPEAVVSRAGYLYDRASYIALPPAVRTRFAEKICSTFKGKMLMVALESDNTESGPPFCLPEGEVEREFGKFFEIRMLSEIRHNSGEVKYPTQWLKEKALWMISR